MSTACRQIMLSRVSVSHPVSMKTITAAAESPSPESHVKSGVRQSIQIIEFAAFANPSGPTSNTNSPPSISSGSMKRPSESSLASAETTSVIRSEISQRMRISIVLCGFLVLLTSGCEGCNNIDAAATSNGTVSYDHRALLIDGQRRFLISGSIHYPRSTPQMWPKLINLAKEGGLDVIQTYVFWDGHEQQRGQYYFEDRYDLVSFLEIIHEAGLYVNLRIGPYISAEWNFGGFPEWLREIPGIEFRTDNEPFKAEMERFVSYIVEKMKQNKLFYSQGGPIILSQVENEYGMIEQNYKDAGAKYVEWAAAMAVNLNTSVPWIMCKQWDAPDNIIDTCNAFYCDNYIPTVYNKPKMWTENWTGWFHSWGTALPHRPVEDLAFSTARFFQKGGSFVNYYMYHGGTNFGRTSAAGVTTSYDYDAPIDEYGEVSQPKWGHLKDLHAALKLCEPALAIVDRDPRHWKIPGWDVEIDIYTNSTVEGFAFERSLAMDSTILCASFFSNYGMTDITVDFMGRSYDLPAWSVSILPDCKSVSFNTAKVAAQASMKQIVQIPAEELGFTTLPSKKSFGTSSWSRDGSSSSELEAPEDYDSDELDSSSSPLGVIFARDVVGVWGQGIVHQGLLEQINTTHDMTDYFWYTTTVDIPENSNLSQDQETPPGDNGIWLTIETVRTIAYVFVNGKPAGGYPIWQGTSMSQRLTTLKPGNNSIAVLSSLTGLWYAGPFYEKEVGGLSGSIMLQGIPNVGDMDLTELEWIHQVGLKGEKRHTNGSDIGVGKLNWSSEIPPAYEPLVWYKIRLHAPGGDSPLMLDMSSMGKGAAWINGHHLGRYWVTINNPQTECYSDCDYRGPYEEEKKCISDCGQPSQRWYHVPREWLKPRGNRLIVFEEIGGNVTGISLSTQVVHNICAHVSESDPPSTTDYTDTSPNLPLLQLDCGTGQLITGIDFASYGDPLGQCGQFTDGECDAPTSTEVLEEICVGRQFCSTYVEQSLFGNDPCPGKVKALAVQATCQPASQ